MEVRKEEVKDLVKNIVWQLCKFKVPDKYFNEIESKLTQEVNLFAFNNRYINEIYVLRLKDRISISQLNKYTGSSTIWRKLIPIYLKEAETLYVKGHSAAGIFFCRLAIETALRDRIFKRKIKLKKITNLPGEEKRLSEETFGTLLKEAHGNTLKILDSSDMDRIFSKFKRARTSLLTGKDNVLNKFMHGDFLWIKDFLEKDRKITVTHEEKTTKEFIAYPNNIASFIFMEILEATYKILLLLYP